MSHLIDMSNGQAAIAYVGEKPWHGLGSELQPGADLDVWCKAAGLDWQANRTPLYYRAEPDKRVLKAEQQILYRSDTGIQLGIVSDRYKIVQPADVLEFFRDVVGVGGMELETAGSLDDGKKVWAMARTGHSMRLKGQDEVNGYLLLSTSFDGSLATRAMFTSVRVVCNNTLSMANAAKGGVKVPHSAEFDARGTKIELGVLGNAWAEFENQAEQLAETRLSKEQVMELMLKVLAPEVKADDQKAEISTRKANMVKTVFDLYQYEGRGSNLAAARGTAWGVVNAITEYVDHQAARNANNRFRSAQFGEGAAMKAKAFEMALALVA